MESGIQLEESQPLESGIQVPLAKNPESSTWSPESMAWNPEYKMTFYPLMCMERSVSTMCISWIFIRKGVGLILELRKTITSVDFLVQFYPWFNFYLTMNLNQGSCSAALKSC